MSSIWIFVNLKYTSTWHLCVVKPEAWIQSTESGVTISNFVWAWFVFCWQSVLYAKNASIWKRKKIAIYVVLHGTENVHVHGLWGFTGIKRLDNCHFDLINCIFTEPLTQEGCTQHSFEKKLVANRLTYFHCQLLILSKFQ